MWASVLVLASCSSSGATNDGTVAVSGATVGGPSATGPVTGRGDRLPFWPSTLPRSSAGATGQASPETASGAAEGTPAACAVSRPSGWVRTENARAGQPLPTPPETASGVLGYLDRGSARCGDTVGVHLGLAPGLATRRVWMTASRLGWYGGAGARQVWRSADLSVSSFPMPSGAAAPHLVTPAWPVSVALTIDRSWPPGFYLLVPRDGGGPAGPAIPLVVRHDGGSEPILFKASTLTWNAYGEWGGWSLYRGPSGTRAAAIADRARVVALHRPLTGSGYEQLTLMDLPVVHQLEQLAVRQGIDVAYTTDVAMAGDPAQLLHHNEFVSGGHSEYWTTRMYDGLLAAADAGVNLTFLGANNLWWRARLEGVSAQGEPLREVVYRVAGDDPISATDPAEATVLWQAAPYGRDPAAVLGQSHAGIGVDGGLQLLDAPSWYTAGTQLRPGSLLPDAVGNEADGFNPRARNPVDTQLFAVGVLKGHAGPVLVSNSYSTRPSGAAVFAAGTTDWACAPTGDCGDHLVPAATARTVATLTQNVLAVLATPRAGTTHPARPTRPVDAATLLPTLPGPAIGTYGGADTDEAAHRRH